MHGGALLITEVVTLHTRTIKIYLSRTAPYTRQYVSARGKIPTNDQGIFPKIGEGFPSKCAGKSPQSKEEKPVS